jgi:uncharacterized protein (TIGR02118 family)
MTILKPSTSTKLPTMMTRAKYYAVISAIILLISCKTSKLTPTSLPEPGMFRIAILYPNGKEKTFDMDYYEKIHMPMMAGFLGENLKFYEIDKGIAGRTPNDEIPFLAIGYFYCYNIAEYNNAVAKNIEVIRNDIKKYTNIQPTIQISEIRQVVNNKK